MTRSAWTFLGPWILPLTVKRLNQVTLRRTWKRWSNKIKWEYNVKSKSESWTDSGHVLLSFTFYSSVWVLHIFIQEFPSRSKTSVNLQNKNMLISSFCGISPGMHRFSSLTNVEVHSKEGLGIVVFESSLPFAFGQSRPTLSFNFLSWPHLKHHILCVNEVLIPESQSRGKSPWSIWKINSINPVLIVHFWYFQSLLCFYIHAPH